MNASRDSHPRTLRYRLGTFRKNLGRTYQRLLGDSIAKGLSRFHPADIAIFHEFEPPPAGGGHQFLRALWRELEQLGYRVENNSLSPTTFACLFNSYNFDFERLQRLRRDRCRMVHRVDGPMGVYRGRDDGSDLRIWQMNQNLADVTIFQSQYSLQKHLELGMKFRSPCVIFNAVDPSIFHAQGRINFYDKEHHLRRKIRLISTSWSNNLNKGGPVYKWLEDQLDWSRFEYTFIGHSPVPFGRLHALPALPSQELANILRQHDIFITASQYEACSNAVLEALSCGLPVIYIRSGSNAELVQQGGLGFDDCIEIPGLLEQLVSEYQARQAAISIPSLAQVAEMYLEQMDSEHTRSRAIPEDVDSGQLPRQETWTPGGGQ